MKQSKSILYIFSGLPGTGKSTLAKNIAKLLNAFYIRIDTIEQGIIDLCDFKVQGEGYKLAYRIIEDNLKIGNNVISDQCNPWKLTRNGFENIAIKNNCEYVNIEIICSNKNEHKIRIENRKINIWEDVMKRENDPNYYLYYEPWDEKRIIIDTANGTIEECIKELLEKIKSSTAVHDEQTI